MTMYILSWIRRKEKKILIDLLDREKRELETYGNIKRIKSEANRYYER